MSYNVYRVKSDRWHFACMLSLNDAEDSAVTSLQEVGEKLFLIDRAFLNSLSNQKDPIIWLLKFEDGMGETFVVDLS